MCAENSDHASPLPAALDFYRERSSATGAMASSLSAFLLALLLASSASLARAGHFTNEWAAQIDGGDEEAARVAAELGCVVKGECGGGGPNVAPGRTHGHGPGLQEGGNSK